MVDKVDDMQKKIVKLLSHSDLNMKERAAVLTSVMFVMLNFKSNQKFLKRIGIEKESLSVEVTTSLQQLLTIQYMEEQSYIQSANKVLNEAEKILEENSFVDEKE